MPQPDYISAIRTGDQAVLTQMYKAIFPAIHALIRDNGGSEDDAKDIFQDATIVVFEKSRKPDFQLTSQFSTFFYGICRNLWMTWRQKKAASEVTIPEDAKYIADDSQEVDFLRVERGKLFFKALQSLGEDCQQVLQLFFQKTPMEEIAAQMGYGSEGYARRRKSQCKDRLIEIIENSAEFPELKNS